MLQIENGIPAPKAYAGRKSKTRDEIIETMRHMSVGQSFRVDYKLASMRNIIRNKPVDGVFRAAQESEQEIRVWRIG